MISLGNLIERDKKEDITYQIQAMYNLARIVKINKKILDICLFEYDLQYSDYNLKCSIIQYSLTNNDIKNNYFPLVGCLVKNKITDNIIATLDYIFISDNINGDSNMGNILKGKFNIVLTNLNNNKKIIREFENYCGDDNIVHLLVNILTDNIEEFII